MRSFLFVSIQKNPSSSLFLTKALLKQGIFYNNHDELIYFVVCEGYFNFPTYNYRYNLIICQLGLTSNMLKVVLPKVDLSPEFHFYVLA
jgi:hypothetical protein